MLRQPHAMLVRLRGRAITIPQLGLACDDAEFPIVAESAKPLTYWSGIAIFDGTALPYPLRGAGTVTEKLPLAAKVAISDTTMYAILVPPDRKAPTVWLAAPIARLN